MAFPPPMQAVRPMPMPVHYAGFVPGPLVSNVTFGIIKFHWSHPSKSLFFDHLDRESLAINLRQDFVVDGPERCPKPSHKGATSTACAAMIDLAS